MSPGTPSGSAFARFARIRCDGLMEFQSLRAKPVGCVFAQVRPVWRISLAEYPAAAKHIRLAQNRRLDGLGKPRSGKPLTRTYDPGMIDANRAKAAKLCRPLRRQSPKGDCDEYPFATTRQGCSQGPCSVKIINAHDNRGSGAKYGWWLKVMRVKDGDRFYVKVVP